MYVLFWKNKNPKKYMQFFTDSQCARFIVFLNAQVFKGVNVYIIFTF